MTKTTEQLNAELESVKADFVRKMAAANRLRAGLETKINELIAERDAIRAELATAKEALLINDTMAVTNFDNQELNQEDPLPVVVDDEPFTPNTEE